MTGAGGGVVEFGPTGIRYRSYPYVGASVHPHGHGSTVDIRDVDRRRRPARDPPPQRRDPVRLRRTDDLRAFCEEHAVPVRRRPDVWADLLEPFLDTEFTVADDERTATRLHQAGLDRDEIARIRAQVGDAMVAYNFGSMLWEWVHLGLFDLLEAHSGNLAGERFRLAADDFAELYRKAMAVADRSYDQNSSQA
ncbi:MAG: hypothetical protein ACRD2W_18425 [Acidimicrobiales bacterium]